MKRLLAAEALKLATTRTAAALALAALLLAAGFTALVAAVLPASLSAGETGRAALEGGLGFVPYVLAVLGVIAVTAEYRHRTVTYTFLAEPRRARVLLAKLAVVAAAGALLTVVAALLAAAVVAAAAALRDLPLALAPSPARLAAWALAGALVAAFGVALGALLRAQVATVTGVLVWALAVESVVVGLKPAVGRWLPFTVFGQVAGERLGGATETLSRPLAALVGFAYVAALAVAALLVSLRRDVT